MAGLGTYIPNKGKLGEISLRYTGWNENINVGWDKFPIGSVWNCYVNPQIISFDSIVDGQNINGIHFALLNWFEKDFRSTQLQLEREKVIGIVLLTTSSAILIFNCGLIICFFGCYKK
jgi:hypothetical protein